MAALAAAVAQQDAELADYAGNDPDRYDRLSEPLWERLCPSCGYFRCPLLTSACHLACCLASYAT